MPLSPRFLKGVRLTHLYLGVFAAPAVLFFAFTGAIQTFSLHETTRGSSYEPPRILVILGQIHKKQTPVIQEKKPQPPPKPAPGQDDATSNRHDSPADPEAHTDPASHPATRPGVLTSEPGPQHNPLPLKIFFLLVAISLTLSTLTGLYMAYAYTRNKVVTATLLLLGTIVPVLMVLL